MSGEHTIRLSLTQDYAKSWKIWEGLREVIQNWYDGLLSTIDHLSTSGAQTRTLEGPVISRSESDLSEIFKATAHFTGEKDEIPLGRIEVDKLENSLYLINNHTELARNL